MDELPPWLSFQSQNPVLRSVLDEMLRNPQLRETLNAAFAAREGREMFEVAISDQTLLDRINASRPRGQQVRIGPQVGGAALFTAQPDSVVHHGGILVDVDRLHGAVKQDSARARELVRDALLHEFAHAIPVAQERHLRAQVLDPKPGARNVAQHPIIQGENALRKLLGLPEKKVYGLLFN